MTFTIDFLVCLHYSNPIIFTLFTAPSQPNVKENSSPPCVFQRILFEFTSNFLIKVTMVDADAVSEMHFPD